MTKYDFSNEAKETTTELQGDMDLLKPIPTGEIEKLLPARTDQEQLKDLIKAVDAETDENKKRAILTERLGQVTVGVKNVVEKIISGAIRFM